MRVSVIQIVFTFSTPLFIIINFLWLLFCNSNCINLYNAIFRFSFFSYLLNFVPHLCCNSFPIWIFFFFKFILSLRVSLPPPTFLPFFPSSLPSVALHPSLPSSASLPRPSSPQQAIFPRPAPSDSSVVLFVVPGPRNSSLNTLITSWPTSFHCMSPPSPGLLFMPPATNPFPAPLYSIPGHLIPLRSVHFPPDRLIPPGPLNSSWSGRRIPS